jgi:hypothetical protein
LTAVANNDRVPHFEVAKNPSDFSGVSPKLTIEVSKALNFTIDYSTDTAHRKMLKAKFNITHDFTLMLISLRFLRVQNISAFTTTPVTHIDIIVLVSRYKPYSAFEKILMPFDEEVWILLISTLLFLGILGIVVKLVIRRSGISLSREYRNISYLHSL